MRCPACGGLMLWRLVSLLDGRPDYDGAYYCPRCDGEPVDRVLRREGYPQLPGMPL